MKHYSFLIESVSYQHKFKVGDKIRVRKHLRCKQTGKEGIVLKVEKSPRYDYDFLTCKISDGSVITMNDGSFEKL